jgi:hypothetical protein
VAPDPVIAETEAEVEADTPVERMPNASSPRTAAELAPAAPSTANSQMPPDTTSDQASSLADELRDAPNPAAAESGSLAALVEQVQNLWMPPDELTQPLTYTLIFDADGTLTDVIPNDALSEQYRDRSGIPDAGTEWSPSVASQTVQLVLTPDGDVTIQEATP